MAKDVLDSEKEKKTNQKIRRLFGINQTKQKKLNNIMNLYFIK